MKFTEPLVDAPVGCGPGELVDALPVGHTPIFCF